MIDEKKAREIIARIAGDAIELAVIRHSLEDDAGELDKEQTESIKADVIRVLCNDETGCLDESELTPENSAILWLQEQ